MRVCPQSKGNEGRNVQWNSHQDLPQTLTKYFYDHLNFLELYLYSFPVVQLHRSHIDILHTMLIQYKNK